MTDAPAQRDLAAYIQGDRFVKTRDFRSHPKYRWKFWPRLRRSKAAREAHCYEIMRSLGVPCPNDVRVSETRNLFGLLVASEISMELLTDATDLRFLCLREEYQHLLGDSRFRRALVDRIAHYVGIMHAHDFFPLNLHFRNIMVETSAEQLPPAIWFIDCVSGQICHHPRRRRYYLVKDLAFLYQDARRWCTARERVRFMHQLLGRNKLTPADRDLMDRIVAYARKKWGERTSSLAD